MSKMRKIKATKKKRRENGKRLSSFVENPHSNGLLASRSIIIFFLHKNVRIINKKDRIILMHLNIINTNIF